MSTLSAPNRKKHLHVLLSEEEVYRVRMVVADSGVRMSNLTRQILMREIDRRFQALDRRGVKK